MKISGIYKIENTLNKKVYIGESVDTSRRFEEHRDELNQNKHHSFKLQSDWNEYGSDSFTFEVIEIIPTDADTSHTKLVLTLLCREHYFINKYNSIHAGYNVENTILEILEKRKGIFNDCPNEKDYNFLTVFLKYNNSVIEDGFNDFYTATHLKPLSHPPIIGNRNLEKLHKLFKSNPNVINQVGLNKFTTILNLNNIFYRDKHHNIISDEMIENGVFETYTYRGCPNTPKITDFGIQYIIEILNNQTK